jgi:hypothetical protein
MSNEKKEPKLTTQDPLYTDGEVSDIMHTLGRIYSLDDAIYNQEQLRRPETYIQPLRDIRAAIASRLIDITAKGKPEEPVAG